MIKYAVTLFSAGMIVLAVLHVARNKEQWETIAPPIEPTRSPFSETVASAGVIEAQTENISIGSPVPGVVVEVMAQVGRRVSSGSPLFRLDDRSLLAELKVRQAMLASAQAELERLNRQPRPEQLPTYEAKIREAESYLSDQEYRYQRIERLYHDGKAEENEYVQQKNTFHMAQAKLAQAVAELALIKAGAWELDRQVAGAAVARAEAGVEQVQMELERLTVRALVDGQVLQVNVRPGEFVAAPSASPLVVLGNLQRLHVRADIDEYDIPRFREGASGVALLKGRSEKSLPLRFVRVEPFVIPKRSLTGMNAERVDTRVLQVIYAIETPDESLYVGQQVDVYFDADGTVERVSESSGSGP